MTQTERLFIAVLFAYVGAITAETQHFQRNTGLGPSARDRYQYNLDQLPNSQTYTGNLPAQLYVPETPFYQTKIVRSQLPQLQEQGQEIPRQWKTEQPPHEGLPVYDKTVQYCDNQGCVLIRPEAAPAEQPIAQPMSRKTHVPVMQAPPDVEEPTLVAPSAPVTPAESGVERVNTTLNQL